MDPISAVSFAGTIIQFIDFSSKLVAGTYEIYKSASGTTAENVHITAVVRDLQMVTEELGSDITGNTKHEKALRSLAAECERLAADLLSILEKLKVPDQNSAWKSMKVKWASMRKCGELQSIERRLGKYRSEILLRLSLMLGDQQSSLKAQLDRIQSDGERFRTESADRLSKVREDILKAVEQSMAGERQSLRTIEFAPTQETRVQSEQPHPTPAQDTRSKSGLQSVKSFLDDLSTMMMSMPPENCILEHLYFRSMHYREDAIHGAEYGTYEWLLGDERVSPDKQGTNISEDDLQRKIFEKERERRLAARTSFLLWLRESNGVYHISGKAGSGKSTLMKFLCQHPTTEKGLSAWAGDKKLVFARFFFWKPGEELQRSLHGLYRSLLFEVLRQCPEMIPRVFPRQFELLRKTGRFTVTDSTLFRPSHIQEAFHLLVQHTGFPTHRFCFFIDGLDEYDGDSVDHKRLADDLKTWASSEDIKLCVSSRPHVEFHLAFTDTTERRMHLHELTRHDIYLYSRQMLENAVDTHYAGREYLCLVRDVVTMSEGVFLWAWIVVRSLFSQIMRHDSIKVLRSTLASTPKELDALYTQLLDSLEPQDQRRAAQMLLLVASDRFPPPPTSVAFWWLDSLQDPEFPSVQDIMPFTPVQLQKVASAVESQVKSITKGFLELVPFPPNKYFREGDKSVSIASLGIKTCRFFHRTARDFVVNHPRLSEIIDVQAISSPETRYRLKLAEILSYENRYRCELVHSEYVLFMLFGEGLSISLLEKYEHVCAKTAEGLGLHAKISYQPHRVLGNFDIFQSSFVHLALLVDKRNTYCKKQSKIQGYSQVLLI